MRRLTHKEIVKNEIKKRFLSHYDVLNFSSDNGLSLPSLKSFEYFVSCCNKREVLKASLISATLNCKQLVLEYSYKNGYTLKTKKVSEKYTIDHSIVMINLIDCSKIV